MDVAKAPSRTSRRVAAREQAGPPVTVPAGPSGPEGEQGAGGAAPEGARGHSSAGLRRRCILGGALPPQIPDSRSSRLPARRLAPRCDAVSPRAASRRCARRAAASRLPPTHRPGHWSRRWLAGTPGTALRVLEAAPPCGGAWRRAPTRRWQPLDVPRHAVRLIPVAPAVEPERAQGCREAWGRGGVGERPPELVERHRRDRATGRVYARLDAIIPCSARRFHMAIRQRVGDHRSRMLAAAVAPAPPSRRDRDRPLAAILGPTPLVADPGAAGSDRIAAAGRPASDANRRAVAWAPEARLREAGVKESAPRALPGAGRMARGAPRAQRSAATGCSSPAARRRHAFGSIGTGSTGAGGPVRDGGRGSAADSPALRQRRRAPPS